MFGRGSSQSGGVLSAQLDLPGGTWQQNPLAVTYPGITTLLNYPLFVTNVKLLCENRVQKSKDGWSPSNHQSSSSSIQATFRSLRHTFRSEGFRGLYCGAHLYVLHLSLKEGLRFLSDRGVRALKRHTASTAGSGEGEEVDTSREDRWWWRLRMVVKYMIDAVCYPVILTATRGIVLRGSPQNIWQHVCTWKQEEGMLSLFSGLTSSLLSTACDEAMDMLLAVCIDRYAVGTNVDIADKLLLKASGSSVVSIFTSPINYVGVIQRCQSQLPGLLEPGPLLQVIWSLPWWSSFNQLLIFSGILALNVKVTQWKLELKAEEEANLD